MARSLTRDERIEFLKHENKDKYGPNDFRSHYRYCTAFIDGMIEVEQTVEKFKNNGSEYLRGFREGASNGGRLPMDITVMGYRIEEICKLITEDEERKANQSIIDKLISNPTLRDERERFRQALADLEHSEATCYSHWALKAFDKANGLR